MFFLSVDFISQKLYCYSYTDIVITEFFKNGLNQVLHQINNVSCLKGLILQKYRFSLPPVLREPQLVLGFDFFIPNSLQGKSKRDLFSWVKRQELLHEPVEDVLPWVIKVPPLVLESLSRMLNPSTLSQSPNLQEGSRIYLCLPSSSLMNVSTSPQCCVPTFL